MATKKRKEDDEAGLDKKRRKSGVAANGAELHEEQQPIVSICPIQSSVNKRAQVFLFARIFYNNTFTYKLKHLRF